MEAVLLAPTFVAASARDLSPDGIEKHFQDHSDVASAASWISNGDLTACTDPVEFYETSSANTHSSGKEDSLVETKQKPSITTASAASAASALTSTSASSSRYLTSNRKPTSTDDIKNSQEQTVVTTSEDTLRSFNSCFNDYGSIVEKGSIATATTYATESTYDATLSCSPASHPLQLPYSVEIVKGHEETISTAVKEEDIKLVNSILSWCAHHIHSPSERAGRVLALLAAVMYGTSFAGVKVLDDSVPMAIAALCRFAIGAMTVTSITLHQEAHVSWKEASLAIIEQQNRRVAMWCGAEIGFWYSLGYLFQGKDCHRQ